MAQIKDESFTRIMTLSFRQKGGYILCNICDARFATRTDFMCHLIRQHKNDSLPEHKKEDKSAVCPFRGYQGVTGLEGLQPTCDFYGHPCHCPVIDMNTGESIDCDNLNQDQLKAARAAKRRR
jgi:hypothetical protein